MRLSSLLAFVCTGLGLAGCGATYEPGSFTDYGRVDEPRMRALGCVDVRVQPRGPGAMPDGYVAIDYELGNRCTRPVEVALEGARVVVVRDTAEVGTAPLFDPRGEVKTAVLDGQGLAREALAYETGATREPERVCIDLSGVVVGEARSVAPVCFVREGEQMNVEVL